ncbi:hypothetical protein ACFXTO_033379 [Malus domestica]
MFICNEEEDQWKRGTRVGHAENQAVQNFNGEVPGKQIASMDNDNHDAANGSIAGSTTSFWFFYTLPCLVGVFDCFYD